MQAKVFKYKSLNKLLLISLVIFFSSFNYTNGLIDDVLDVLHVTKLVASGILSTWNIIENTKVGEHIDLPITREKSKKVLSRIGELSRKIDQNHLKYSTFTDYAVESINTYVKSNIRLELELHEIKDIINRISSRSAEMKLYEEHKDTLEDETLIKFSEWNVSPNGHSINHMLERLHLLFAGTNRENRSSGKSTLTTLAENLKRVYSVSHNGCRTEGIICNQIKYAVSDKTYWDGCNSNILYFRMKK